MLRTPDLRLADVRAQLLRFDPNSSQRIDEPERSICVYVRRGDFTLQLENSKREPIMLRQGSTVGFEDGRPHSWQSANAGAELFISSIPRHMGVLKQLLDGLVIVAPDAEPYATILRLTVELHVYELLNGQANHDDAIERRCAEIGLMQFVRFAQSNVSKQQDAPPGLAHDEHLLRAWSAYFAEPRRRWTVQALADVAGLSRTGFAERFHKVFGAPPLHTLTALRLKQAESMLLHSGAPLIEIAFTAGYNSEAAFVRAFHREYGIPPGRYRLERGGGDKLISEGSA